MRRHKTGGEGDELGRDQRSYPVDSENLCHRNFNGGSLADRFVTDGALMRRERASRRNGMIVRLISARLRRFKISCAKMAPARNGLSPWRIEFYLTSAGSGSRGLQLENCQIASP